MLAKKVNHNLSSKVVTLTIPAAAGSRQQPQRKSTPEDYQAVDFDSLEQSQYQLEPETRLDANSKPRSILTAILAGVTFSLSLYIAYTWIQKYVYPNPAPTTTKKALESGKLKPTPPTSSRMSQREIEAPNRYQLQEMALNIMQDSDWDLLKVHYLALSWQKMPLEEQLAARDSIWFQLFEDSLKQEINKYINQPDANEQTLTTRVDSLNALTEKLRTLNAPSNKAIARNQISVNGNENPVKRVKPPSPPRSSAKKAERKAQSRPAQSSTRETRNSNTLIKTPEKKAVQTTIADKNQLISRPQTVQKSSPADRSTKRKNPNKLTYAELNDITTQFVDAYESGNLKKLSALFANNAVSNTQNNLAAIKKEYEQLFSKTTDRQMFIYDLDWTFNKNVAVGKGVLELVTLSTSDAKMTTRKGKVQLVAEKNYDKVLITRFYHLIR